MITTDPKMRYFILETKLCEILDYKNFHRKFIIGYLLKIICFKLLIAVNLRQLIDVEKFTGNIIDIA